VATLTTTLKTLLAQKQPLTALQYLAYAQQSLPLAQHPKASAAVDAWRNAEAGNPNVWMLKGMAELLFDNNDTGLFFLRKANDELDTSVSQLAYALGLAYADTALVPANQRTEVTQRKLNASYAFRDAFTRDVATPTAGLWPVAARALTDLRLKNPAFEVLLASNYSDAYLPYGNRRVDFIAPSSVEAYWQSLAPKAKTKRKAKKMTEPPTTLTLKPAAPCPQGHDPEGQQANATHPPCALVLPTDAVVSVRHVKHKGATADDWLSLYTVTVPATEQTADAKAPPYRVIVANQRNEWLGIVPAYRDANLLEDINRDGEFEVVLRQEAYNPLQPVRVFSVSPQGLSEAKELTRHFE
jgi:hypothetical protein